MAPPPLFVRPEATHQAFWAVFAYRLAWASHSSSVLGRFCLSSGSGEPLIKRFGPFLLIVWLGRATHQAFWAVFAYRLAWASHSSSILGRFCLSSGSGEPRIKRFRPFLLIVWLGRATHQAFWAVFAVRLARVSHSSSVLGRFCCLAGLGEPLVKRFGAFLLIVWLG